MVVGMPAILKGFIDRIFVAGFAYKYEGSAERIIARKKRGLLIR